MPQSTRINGTNAKYDRAYVKKTERGDISIALSGYDRQARRPGYVHAFFSPEAAHDLIKALQDLA